MKVFTLMLVLAATLRGAEMTSAAPHKTVVLLHGLGRSAWAMSRLARMLRADGYRVVNLTYPSRTMPIEQLASTWLPAQLQAAGIDPDERVDFVTHSMGGIILRLYRRGHPGEFSGRAVMLAPPNAGSEVVDHLVGFAPFRWFTGVNGARLGTDTRSVPCSLGPWPATAGDLGIIAGDRSLNPVFSAWFDGPNDGKVSVARARLEGMADFVVVPHSHTWLSWTPDVLAHVRTFLRTGEFHADLAPATVGRPA